MSGGRRRVSASLAFCLLVPALLSACGGMNRVVGVLPTTLDDLERRTAPARGKPATDAPGNTP